MLCSLIIKDLSCFRVDSQGGSISITDLRTEVSSQAMNIYFVLIISIIVVDFIVDRWLDYLNLKNWSPELPKEAEGIYDAEKYRKSMEYYKVNHRFGLLT